MTEIQTYLFSVADPKYRAFTLPLIPGVDEETFIGVRQLVLQKYAKSLDEATKNAFLDSLPHSYHEENLLHACILSNIRNYDEFLKRIDAFLPYVSNWAVCDSVCNKHLDKHRGELLPEVYRWLESDEPYRVRYGVKCLMNYFLSEHFQEEHLARVRKICLDEYYVKMMVAWYLATGLAKNYDSFIKAIEGKTFDPFTHNKAIQKAVESYRVSENHKEYLKTLKVR